MLIVQDPTNPTTEANSYVSLADARTRALFLGVTLPTDDDKATAGLFQGAQYVDSKCYNGTPVIEFQGTAMPRNDLYIGGALYPSDQIPQDFIDAQILAAAEAGEGSLWSSESVGSNVKAESVGSLSVEYFAGGQGSGFIKVGRADSILSKYACSGFGVGGLGLFKVI